MLESWASRKGPWVPRDAQKRKNTKNAPGPDDPRPRRGRGLERVAIGGLLGAAAFLGVGEWIHAAGGG